MEFNLRIEQIASNITRITDQNGEPFVVILIQYGFDDGDSFYSISEDTSFGYDAFADTKEVISAWLEKNYSISIDEIKTIADSEASYHYVTDSTSEYLSEELNKYKNIEIKYTEK